MFPQESTYVFDAICTHISFSPLVAYNFPQDQDLCLALAGVAQLVGVSSHNPNIAGSIPGQGTY